MIDLSQIFRDKGWESDHPVKLDIGAGGPSSDPDFLSVDLFVDDADINADMLNIPLPDESVDSVFSANALEHMPKFQIVPALREFNRVLKTGGHMLLFVPDLEWACRWWLEHPDTSWNMDIIYGNQLHEGEFHKTGFTKKILFKYIGLAGGFVIHSMEFVAGEFYEKIAITETQNQFVQHVEQRGIQCEISKTHDWRKGQQLDFAEGWELSTEMINPKSRPVV